MTTSIGFDIYAKDRASGTLTKVGERADATGRKVGGIGKFAKAGAVGLVALATGAAVFTAKVGPSYVDNLNKIETLTGSTASQTRAAARELEKQTIQYARMGMSVGDASTGVVELSKAGLSLKDSLAAVSGTMVLAKAGELGVADATTLVSNTLQTFNLKASRAADVANYLANAANISSADVVDLAEAFKYVAPVAASAGVKVETVNAMLAQLANKGINASVAGTGLRNLFTSLQSPAGKGAKSLQQLGVEVFDTEGKMRPFKTVLGELSTSIAKVDDETRKAALKNIFGKEGLTSAQILLEGGTKALEQYEAGVVKAGGATRFAQSASKGLAGSLSIIKAGATSGAQAMYRELSPIADRAVRPIAVAFADLASKAGPGIANLASTVGPKLKAAFSGGGASGMGAQLSKTGASIANFGRSLLPTLSAIGGRIKSTLGPGLASIAGVVKSDLLPAIQSILPVVTPVAKFLLNMLGSAFVGVLGGAISVVKGLLKVVSGVFNVISGIVTGDWSKAWKGLKQVVTGVGGAILGAIRVWWNVGILALFKRGLVFVTKTIWVNLWNGLKSGASAGLRGVGNMVRAGIAGIWRLFMSGVRGYINIWRNGFRVLRSAFGGAWAAIRTVVSTSMSAVRGAVVRGANAVVNAFRTGWSRARSAVSSGVGKVTSFVSGVPGKIKSSLGNLAKLLYSAGREVIAGLWNGISNKWNEVKGKVGEIGSKVAGAIKGMLKIASPSKVMIEIGEFVTEGLAVGIASLASGRRLKSAVGFVTNQVAGLKAKLGEFANGEFAAGFLGVRSSLFGADYGEQGTGLGSVIAFQARELAQAQQYQRDVEAVAEKGISASLLQQLQESGQSGMAALRAIASGSVGDIARLNDLNAQTEMAYASAGMTAAKRAYDSTSTDLKFLTQMEAAMKRALKASGDQTIVLEIDGKTLRYAVNKYDNTKKGK